MKSLWAILIWNWIDQLLKDIAQIWACFSAMNVEKTWACIAKSDCSKNPTDILTIRKVVKATQKCSISHVSISTLSTWEMFNKYLNQFRHVSMVFKFVSWIFRFALDLNFYSHRKHNQFCNAFCLKIFIFVLNLDNYSHREHLKSISSRFLF